MSYDFERTIPEQLSVRIGPLPIWGYLLIAYAAGFVMGSVGHKAPSKNTDFRPSAIEGNDYAIH